MAEVKLSSKLPNPRSSDRDGLRVIADALLQRPNDCHLIVALVSAEETTTRHHDGGRVLKVGVDHVEVVLPEDREVAESLLLGAYKARVGQPPLPLPGLERAAE